MFADNNRITHRQLGRQMVLALIGPFLLFVADDGAAGGISGFLGAALGFAFLLLWIFFLVRKENGYNHMERYMGTVGKWMVRIVYFSFLAVTGSYLLERTAWIAGTYLVEGVKTELLSFFLVLAAGLSMGGDLQRRARLAEVLYPFLILGFIVLLFLAGGSIRTDAFYGSTEELTDGAVWTLSKGGVCLAAKKTLMAGCAISLLPFLLPYVERNKSAVRPLFGGFIKVFLVVVGGMFVLVGTFGQKGVQCMEYPVLQLMAGTNVPGGFLQRFDIIWLAFLLAGLLFSLGSILFYGSFMFAGGEKRSCWYSLALGIVIWLGSFPAVRGFCLADWYEEAVSCIYLPVLIGITVLLALAGKMGGRRNAKAAGFFLLLTLFMTGCGVEPEKKTYPLAVSVDYRDGKFQVIYAMADLEALTGQSKSGEGSGSGEESGGGSYSYEAEKIEDVRVLYQECSEYQLDIGHVKALVFGKGVLADEDALRQTLEYLDGERHFGRELYVFSTDCPEEIMDYRGNRDDSVGEYLAGIYDNRVQEDKSAVTLDDVFYSWYNYDTMPALPEVTGSGAMLRVTDSKDGGV